MNKKGLSLVEVVVALSVLMVVFSGTVTLIVAVVNLSVSAREKTEATTYAQKALADGIKQIDFGCRNTPPVSELTYNYNNNKYTAVVEYLLASESGGNFETAGDDFIRVKSTVGWDDRAGNRMTYSLTQIVGRSGQ